MSHEATVAWIALGCSFLFIILVFLFSAWRLVRQERRGLSVLLDAAGTIGMITTDGFARRYGRDLSRSRCLLDRLFRAGLVYGCTDEELCWYWRITDKGRERLGKLSPASISDRPLDA